MKRLSCIAIIILSTIGLFAQSANQADQLFSDKNFAKAMPIYEHLCQINPNSAFYNYRYARCLYELKDFDNAITHFIKAGKKYPLTHFYLGEAYFRTYQFSQAIENFNKYKDIIDSTHANWQTTERRLIQSETGERLIKHVEDIVIIDSIEINKDSFLTFYSLSKEAGSLSYDESGICFTNAKNDRKIATLSTDSVKSLYSSEKLINGWTNNTVFYKDLFDIDYPFVLSDGITLYFAAKNPDGMGGYDIYITRNNPANNTFLKPENIGFPFNSPANDYMLAIDEFEQIGYFATERNAKTNMVKVYKFVYNEEKKYITETNDTLIRSYAQLTLYKLGEQKVIDKNDYYEPTDLTESQQQNNIFFIVSDNVVYTDINQFKSSEAKKIYSTLEADIKTYENNTVKLDNLRIEYSNASESQRQQISQTIMVLEPLIVRQKKAISSKENHIRELEQKEL